MTTRDVWLAADDDALAAGSDFEFTKGTGNGGQKRNKTSSAVRVRHRATGFSAEDCSERSQHRNRALALSKLRMTFALQLRESPARLPERSVVALEHPDYYLWCARMLDVLAEHGYDHKAAAAVLDLSPTAFIKLLFRDPRLWQSVNDQRRSLGMTVLKK